MKRTRLHTLVASTVALSVAATAWPNVVVLEPSKDNTLHSESGELSNGAGEFFFAGRPIANIRRALLAFDLHPVLPGGSVILRVELALTHDRGRAQALLPMTLHRVLTDWGEGNSVGIGRQGRGGQAQNSDATWQHTFYPNEFWSNPGGDFDSEPSAVAMVGGAGTYTWASTPALVADVQRWVDDRRTNFGWLLKGDERSSATAKRFIGRVHADLASRPKLTIEFDVATPTHTTTWGAVKNLYR